MTKKKNRDEPTVVNVAGPGSVVGIQSDGSVAGSTVIVNGTTGTGTTATGNGGGRWLDDPADMDRSLIDDLDD
jgi:hypothetical protein